MFLRRQAASEAQSSSAGPGRNPSEIDPVSALMSVVLHRIVPWPRAGSPLAPDRSARWLAWSSSCSGQRADRMVSA